MKTPYIVLLFLISLWSGGKFLVEQHCARVHLGDPLGLLVQRGQGSPGAELAAGGALGQDPEARVRVPSLFLQPHVRCVTLDKTSP